MNANHNDEDESLSLTANDLDVERGSQTSPETGGLLYFVLENFTKMTRTQMGVLSSSVVGTEHEFTTDVDSNQELQVTNN